MGPHATPRGAGELLAVMLRIYAAPLRRTSSTAAIRSCRIEVVPEPRSGAQGRLVARAENFHRQGLIDPQNGCTRANLWPPRSWFDLQEAIAVVKRLTRDLLRPGGTDGRVLSHD
jgi:hypothetical protein